MGQRMFCPHRACFTFTCQEPRSSQLRVWLWSHRDEAAPSPWLVVTFSSVQSLSRVRLFATPWIAAPQASLSITNSCSLLKLMSIESVMPSSHLILCRPLLLPPIPPSIRVFFNELTLRMRWPKYWNFSFSIIPSKEIPGLISFRMDWLDLLAVHLRGIKCKFCYFGLSTISCTEIYSLSVQFSRLVVSDSLRLHGQQHARLPCPSPTPGACSNSCPLSQWCHPTISSCRPLLPPALSLSQHQGLFQRVSSSHQVAKVLKFQLQHQSLQWILRTDLL